MSASTPSSTGMDDVWRSLGLDPSRSRSGRGALGARQWLPLPSASAPSLLVPVAPGSAELVAQRRARRPRQKVLRWVTVTALRTGLAARLPVTKVTNDDPALDELLAWVGGGVAGTTVGILLGPPRPNRKPVLRLFGPDGDTLAYAKVGHTDLTRDLVRAETEQLARVADLPLRSLTPPRVLRSGRWRDLEVLVTEPLATQQGGRQPSRLPVEATTELMGVGARDDLPLGSLPFLADPLPAGGATDARLPALLERARERWGDTRLPVGAGHGDWTPWNMAWRGDLLQVWDWERFDPAVPAGWDVVHFAASAVNVMDPAGPAPAEARLLAELPGLLESCGLDPSTTTTVLATYLLHIARRYDGDLHVAPATATRTRLTWVLDLLDRQLTAVEREAAR